MSKVMYTSYMRIYCVEKREILEWVEAQDCRHKRVLSHHEHAIGELVMLYLYQPMDRITSDLAEVSINLCCAN